MADGPSQSERGADRALVRFARVVSGGYLVLGILGLFITGFDHFSNVTGVSLLIFTVNPLTNLIHLIVGLVGIPLATRADRARLYAALLGVLGLPFAVAGFFLEGTLSDFFARNPPLVWVHLATALVALGLVAWPLVGPRRERPEPVPAGAVPGATDPAA